MNALPNIRLKLAGLKHDSFVASLFSKHGVSRALAWGAWSLGSGSALGLPACASTQQPAPAPTIDPGDLSQEPFVIETILRRARFESDGSRREDLTVRVRLQQQGAVESYGQLAYEYNADNERLEIDSVRVHRAAGIVVPVAPVIQDLTAPVVREAPIYSDRRQKVLAVPGLEPGDTLEYHVAWVDVAPLAPGNFWYDHDFINDAVVLDEQLEINVPRKAFVNLKVVAGFVRTESDSGDRHIYHWTRSNLRAQRRVPRGPLRRSSPVGEPHDVALTSFRTWEDVGRWYAGLVRDRDRPTPEVRAKALELAGGLADDTAKIRALYDFVSHEFRYVSISLGMGRYQPHFAGEVLSNRYGDCKDKHTLFAALLAAVGVRAYPALISTQRDVFAELPSPSQFDHVISLIPRQRDSLWLDTTPGLAPFGFLFFPLRSRSALVVSPDGGSRLQITPAALPFTTFSRIETEAQLSALGTLTGTVRFTVRGDAEVFLRLAFQSTPRARWDEMGRFLGTADGVHGRVDSVRTGDLSNVKAPFEFSYLTSRPGFIDWSKERSTVRVPLPPIQLANADTLPGGSDSMRISPVQQAFLRLKLSLPTGYVVHLPLPITLTRDYGEYRSNYGVTGSVVNADRELRLTHDRLSPTQREDYAAFLRAVHEDENQALLLEHGGADTLAVPQTAGAAELHHSGLDAINNGDYRTAVRLFRRVIELEPEHKLAWNNLGRAYLELGELDSAVAAFQKQITLNPYDAYAYNNLGRARWRQQRYDDAIAAFQKQIAISPLDRFAHANLGRLLSELHQDSAAAVELGRALTITPQDASLHVALGQVDLALGKADSAQHELDRAIELSPTPATWNGVAYALARHGRHLDRAEQYALAAIAATAARLRNATLQHVDRAALADVAALGHYWDTLGWIYFVNRDLARAERYIRAAWLVNFNGEVGDHLAQVEDGLGRKQEAAHLYALALAATRPLQETRARLGLLVSEPQKIDQLVERARAELPSLRTVRLDQKIQKDLHTEVGVLLGRGGKPEDARVLGGDQLDAVTGALMAAVYPIEFPDDTPVKLIRAGRLTCSASSGECSLLLELPENVTVWQ